jgi:adenylate cyclase
MDNNKAKPTILVVDDYQDNLDLIEAFLGSTYNVKLSSGGEDALKYLGSQPAPDLILMDVMMPHLDGYELLRLIKADEKTKGIPVIFLTAKSQKEDEEKGLQLGAVDYITKPISPPILSARVKNHIMLKATADSLREKNNFIRKTFGRYMSDDIVSKVLESPDGLNLGGESRIVTIMFTDLRGFSSISDRLPPETVVQILNDYFKEMNRIASKYSGTINELVGDGMLILFGAPTQAEDDADRAVACALEMQLAMEGLNTANLKKGFPSLEMGVGINTGKVIAGNLGSDIRVKYGVVGSHVNLASRVESFTVGGQVLVSEFTKNTLRGKLKTRGEFEILLKGVEDRITLYEVSGIEGIYNSALHDERQNLNPVTREIKSTFQVLDGKRIGGELMFGEITHLANKTAVLKTDAKLYPHSNIKINLTVEGLMFPKDTLYAKILGEHIDKTNSGLEIHFTYVPQEAKSILENLKKPAAF